MCIRDRTNDNIRARAKKRKRLLDEDRWVRRFINDFWARYWRHKFEHSLSPEEREEAIGYAMAVIPAVIDNITRTGDEPVNKHELRSFVWESFQKRRASEKKRFR